jgi:hypothetical protein
MSKCVDVAMVIDATGTMEPIITNIKNNAKNLYDEILKKMEEENIDEFELRVKVIPFRDYAYDGNEAMADSGFFKLPEENDAFYDYVSKIEAKGGGDYPESALEAMALAMRSDWTTHGDLQRHVILVFTDAPAVPLQDPERTKNPMYPANMPKDLNELGDMWMGESQELGGMPSPRSARLGIFAPNVEPWSDMQAWNRTWEFFPHEGLGLREIDINMVTDLFGNV